VTKFGGIFLDDKIREVVEQYDVKVYDSRRGRGAFICETDHGLKLVKEYHLSPNRLNFESMVKYIIKDRGYIAVDQFLANKKGELLTKNKIEKTYVMKDWFEGHECDTRNMSDVILTAHNLAALHKVMKNIRLDGSYTKSYCCENTETVFAKHNRELKAIKNYIKNKRQKNEFEARYMTCYSSLYKQAEAALEMLKKSPYKDLFEEAIAAKTMCHGDYNQHHVLIQKNQIATTSFDHLNINIQISDLYLFMRKIMEKNDWNISLGKNIIDAYNEIKEITKAEMEYLYILLLYPEKFWKIANHYYNTRKSWTSGRNIEKLNDFIKQKDARENFLAEIYKYL